MHSRIKKILPGNDLERPWNITHSHNLRPMYMWQIKATSRKVLSYGFDLTLLSLSRHDVKNNGSIHSKINISTQAENLASFPSPFCGNTVRDAL